MSLPSITAPPGTPAFLVDGHAIEEDSVYAQVRTATGHSRARRRWTVMERVVSVGLILEADQLEAFDEWYETALLAGAREFAAQIANQGEGARKLWWRARWISFDIEMMHRGRGYVRGSLFLSGDGSEEGPNTGALAMEVAVPLLDIRSAVHLPAGMAMEIEVALLQPAVLRMEIIVALLTTYVPAAARLTEDDDLRVTEDGDARVTEI